MLWQIPDTVIAAGILWLFVRWNVVSLGWALGLFLVRVAKALALYPLR